MFDLLKITGFDWDQGNARKNEKHGVSMAEAEEVFFNVPLLLLEDIKHSRREPRYHALGRTDKQRYLHVCFTLRQAGRMIGLISARYMQGNERAIYESKAC